MNLYKRNLKKLTNANAYYPSLEHDACGVGFVTSTEGKKSRNIVEFGIQALKAVWHRGAVDADGKTGDGAGIHIEIPTDFFKERIENYGRQYDGGTICVGMIFLPRNDYSSQEKCKTLIETELLSKNYYIYRWRQVPINTKVLGIKAEATRPEIIPNSQFEMKADMVIKALGFDPENLPKLFNCLDLSISKLGTI